MHNLKGERNANRILNDMSEYLSTFRHNLQNVYYLNKLGRERIECPVIRKKTPNIQHFLLRNQLYIHLKQPFGWKNEIKISIKDVSVIADAMYKDRTYEIFCEVDCSQQMIENKRKIDKYRKLKEMTGSPFHLLWITELESRKPKLTELMEGLPGCVYTYKEVR